MSEEKKEQKIDLKDRMLSDDDLNQVAGGSNLLCNQYGHMWVPTNNLDGVGTAYICARCYVFKTE